MADTGENTPGRQAKEVMQSFQNDITLFKTPDIPRKRRNKPKVLDEDSYVEGIGKIIQRDFFPDLEKIRAQNEYLDAVERNDTMKMRELYSKYSGSKPPLERVPSPATFETPRHNSRSESLPNTAHIAIDLTNDKKGPKLTLDQYLNSHTSEDNESFEEILEESERKHRLKYSYLFNEESNSENEQRKILALPSIEEQCKLPEKKLNIDTWGYKNRNYIMYVPDGVEMTKEREKEILEKKHKIIHNNTRLVWNPFNNKQNKESISELATTQAKILDGKVGMDGKELLNDDMPQVGGFSFVRTPSPNPGVMASPLMTWGQIEGTPFRLDGGDTPLPNYRSQGPSFKMSEPPRREQLALALAEKVGEKNNDKKKKAMDAARRLASPSPKISSALERLATMSPAARRLATSSLKLGLTSSMSPYTPRRMTSPMVGRRRTPKWQRIVTPKISNNKIRIVIDKDNTPEDDNNLTDDLLKINVPKRCKASDFF